MPPISNKIIVHHLNDSRSQRILWLLEELGIPYEIKRYQRQHDLLAPPELIAVNPLGKSPVITDGDLNLAESGAIVEYLINKYGKESDKPSTEQGKLDNLYYNHYAEGSLMPLLATKLIFQEIPRHAPFFIRPMLWIVFSQAEKIVVTSNLKRHLALLEKHLERTKGGWFAGGEHPTSADYMMSFPLEAFATEGGALIAPAIKDWVAKVHARPAYRKASIRESGKYSYAKL